MRQKVGPKTLARWSRQYGHTFVGGLHRGGSPGYVLLVTDDHRHFILNPMAAKSKKPEVRADALAPERGVTHWTSCRERWPQEFDARR